MAKKSNPSRPAPKSSSKPGKPSKGPAQSQQDLEAAWSEAREAVPSGPNTDGPPDIPDGVYLVQVLNAKTGVYRSGKKTGTRYFNINYVVHGGITEEPEADGTTSLVLNPEFAGTRVRSQDDLDASREIGDTGKTPMILFSERLARMEIERPGKLADLPVLARNLGNTSHDDGKAFLTVTIKNTVKGPDPSRAYKPTEELRYQNVYVNERWDADQAQELIDSAA